MRQALILILLLPLLSLRCKDKEQDCETVLHAPQEFLDYWHFPSGSWWVYRLQADSTVVDTVTARADSLFYQPYSGEAQDAIGRECRMEYRLTLEHSNIEYFSGGSGTQKGTQFFHGQWGYRGSQGQWYIELLGTVDTLLPYGWMLSHPFVVGQRYASGTYLADTTSVLIAGRYSPAILIQVPKYDDPIHRTYRDRVYAKHIGLVSFDFSNGQVWNLDTFHINK